MKNKWIAYDDKAREFIPEIENGEVYIKNYESERRKEKPKFRKVKITQRENKNIFANENKYNELQTKIHPSRIERIRKYIKKQIQKM